METSYVVMLFFFFEKCKIILYKIKKKIEDAQKGYKAKWVRMQTKAKEKSSFFGAIAP